MAEAATSASRAATLKAHVPHAIFTAGLSAVAAGAGLVYLPAGLIIGGTLSAAAVVLYQRGTP